MTSINRPGSTPGQIQQLRAALGVHADQLIPCGPDKRPSGGSGWQRPERRWTPQQLQHAPAIGLRLGISGLLALDCDSPADDPAAAERTFQALTGRPSADLPETWCWTSGKPGRRQLALLVPQPWRPRLRTRQLRDLEIRWRGSQSIIHGRHPETGRYHWIVAPWDAPVALAPPWLLEAVAPAAPPAPTAAPPPPPASGQRWSEAEAARFYLKWWPAEALPFSEWWATVVVLRRAGISEEEALAWTQGSSKHKGGAEFRRQWAKADRCSAPYSVAWLGARTLAARQRRQGR